jgi:hypothetical protein
MSRTLVPCDPSGGVRTIPQLVYRFTKRYEPAGKPRGYSHSYWVSGPGDAPCFYCDTIRHTVRHPCEVFTAPSKRESVFVIQPVAALIVTTYRVLASDTGREIGALKRRMGGARWSLRDATEREVARLIDPTPLRARMTQALLDGDPDGYAIVAGDRIIADLRKGRKQEPRPGLGPARRFLVLLVTPRDWELTLRGEAADAVDHRLLIAAVLLMHEHDFRLAGSAAACGD